jgi:hypothetical protein
VAWFGRYNTVSVSGQATKLCHNRAEPARSTGRIGSNGFHSTGASRELGPALRFVPMRLVLKLARSKIIGLQKRGSERGPTSPNLPHLAKNPYGRVGWRRRKRCISGRFLDFKLL